jgi:hypothetical protein
LSSWAEFPITVRGDKTRKRLLPNPLEALLLLNARRGLKAFAGFDARIQRFERVIHNSWKLYEAIAAHDETAYVIDSTKNGVRLKHLYLTRPQAVRVIHLVRDGRAVAASSKRRKGNSIGDAGLEWLRSNRNVMLMMAGIPRAQIHRVRYEDFCGATEATTREICDFLHLEFEPSMLDFRATPNHQIPGNPILHNSQNDTVRLDERWKRELSARELEEFNTVYGGVAGLMNKFFGY